MNFIEEFITNHPFISLYIALTLVNGLCGSRVERSDPDE